MEAPSPARLYAAAAGALLFCLGVLGFFYSASFGAPGEVEPMLGALRTNAWLNLLWATLGALGLLTAGASSRAYALFAGTVLTALGVWGLAIGPGDAVLGFIPAAGANEALALVLGLLGLLAAWGTPRGREKRPRRRREGRQKKRRALRPPGRGASESGRDREDAPPLQPRAKAAGKGA